MLTGSVKYFIIFLFVRESLAFHVHQIRQSPRLSCLQAESRGFFQGVKDFFEELDNFIDDASARRLGNGAAFYGKRKSNFYGENDKNRKLNARTPDPTEDYQAPSSGGYFQWTPDEDGRMRPVTRMKKQVVEKMIKDEK